MSMSLIGRIAGGEIMNMPSWLVCNFESFKGSSRDDVLRVQNLKTHETKRMQKSAIIKAINSKKMNFINVKVSVDNRLIERSITQDTERYRVITAESMAMTEHLKKILPGLTSEIADKKYKSSEIEQTGVFFEKAMLYNYNNRNIIASILFYITNTYKWRIQADGKEYYADVMSSKIENVSKELHNNIVRFYLAEHADLTKAGLYFISNYYTEMPLEDLRSKHNLFNSFRSLTDLDLDSPYIYITVKEILDKGNDVMATSYKTSACKDVVTVAAHLIGRHDGTEVNVVSETLSHAYKMIGKGVDIIVNKVKEESKEIKVNTTYNKHENKKGFEYVLTFGYREKVDAFAVHFDYAADEGILYVRSQSDKYGVLDEHSVDIKEMLKAALSFIKDAIILLLA